MIFTKPSGDQYLSDKWLTFNDVLLMPKYSILESRNDSKIDLSTTLGEHLKLQIPIISANMDTITGFDMYCEMQNLGGLGILHRFHGSDENYMKEINRVSPYPIIAFSIGLDDKWIGFSEKIIQQYPDKNIVICIDVAHGHMQKTAEMSAKISDLKLKYKNSKITIIAGNVATEKGAYFLFNNGADVAKVGIGPGGICSTRMITGHGIPQLSAISSCRNAKNCKSIIADGGIRQCGDIVKALAAGANAVMLGGMLSGTDETPGNITEFPDGKKSKLYRGQSSRHFLNDIEKTNVAAEGVSVQVKAKGPVKNIISELAGGIRSGFTYSGVCSIEELQKNALFVEITQNGWNESTTHIIQ